MLDRPNRDEESNALIVRWQTHRDERARDRLTTMHWPLIRAYGSRMASKWGVDVDDATQEAALGFLRALDTYSPELGTLATYVATWARQKVTRFRDDTVGTIRVPVHAAMRNRTMTRVYARLRRDLQRAPTTQEMAEALGWPEERVRALQETGLVSGRLASTSTPVGEDGDMELGDLLEADEDVRPDVRALGRRETTQARAAILQAAELLPERWRAILMLRLVEGRTLTETGETLGVTRERVRQIETKVIERMRDALRFDPRALNLIGLEVDAPETVVRADEGGLGIRDVIAATGMNAGQVDYLVRAGVFPEPVAHSNHRGARLWDPAAVTAWVAARDAASTSTAAEGASAGTSSPDTAEAAPRPPYAPALANSLMGGCSILTVSAAHLIATFGH